MKLLKLIVGCAALIGLAGTSVAQQSYPDRPVRFVVPFPPGGGTDTVSRNLIDKVSRANNWVFAIDNKAGAGGVVGLTDLSNAKPDGYSIGMGQTSNLAINPAAKPNIPFDAVNDFTPVALVAEIPLVIVVPEDSPIKNFADFIKQAKSSEHPIRQAVPGVGTVGHLAGEMLASRADYPVLIVPYKGASPAISDLLGGQTDFMMSTPQGVVGLLKSGKLRAIGVTSTSRIPVLPDVPTVSESGYPDFRAIDWKVVVAPTGVPSDIIQSLNTAVNDALKDPEFVDQLTREGSLPMGGSPEYTAEFVKKEQADWAKLIKDAGIKL